MSYYFTIHLILGLLAGNSVNLILKARSDPNRYPLWLINSFWATIGGFLMVFSAIFAIPTSFFQWGLLYCMATIGEILLGAFIVGFFPITLRIFLALIGPIISVSFIGSLWGFWYLHIPFIS